MLRAACLVLALAIAAGCGGADRPRPPASTTTLEQRAAPDGGGTVVLIGDSLAAGIRDLLPAALPGWTVRVDGRGGRPLADGMDVLARTDLSDAGVLAISLFTNDAPANTRALEAAVRETLARAGPRGCVVWATIVRPPAGGTSYDRPNALLERLATRDRRLRIVPWARRIAAEPALMGADGVHPTRAGYEARAGMYANAVRSCG